MSDEHNERHTYILETFSSYRSFPVQAVGKGWKRALAVMGLKNRCVNISFTNKPLTQESPIVASENKMHS